VRAAAEPAAGAVHRRLSFAGASRPGHGTIRRMRILPVEDDADLGQAECTFAAQAAREVRTPLAARMDAR